MAYGFINVPSTTSADLTAIQKQVDELETKLDDLSYVVSLPTQNGQLWYTGSVQAPQWSNYDANKVTISGSTSGTNAGTYTVTFTPVGDYHWQDGTNTAKQSTWTITRAPMAIPTQAGSLTYTGSAQSPSWNNYDSTKMTLSVTAQTNAGTYTATFTPGSNYQWSDNTTAAKSVNWTIGKATGSMTLSTTTLSVGTDASTFTVSRLGDGTISAVSSSTAICTVSVSGTTVTVTPVAEGTATVTVSCAAGTNYTAPAAQTVAVTVKFVSTTLDDNDWATISKVSLEGTAASYWSVGDTKTITLNGTVGNFTFSSLSIDTFILGFDHNSSVEGSGIHFQIGKIGGVDVALCDDKYSSYTSSSGYFNMNLSDTNSGGWNASVMRKTLLGNSNAPTSPLSGSMMAALPSDLRNVMKAVTKYTDNTGGSTSSSLTATTDYLFLPSQYEVFASQGYALVSESSYQKQYTYYANGNSKIAYKHSSASTACWWWLRSPAYYSNYRDHYDGYFCDVGTGGSADGSSACDSAGVRPCFLV